MVRLSVTAEAGGGFPGRAATAAGRRIESGRRRGFDPCLIRGSRSAAGRCSSWCSAPSLKCVSDIGQIKGTLSALATRVDAMDTAMNARFLRIENLLIGRPPGQGEPPTGD